MRIKISLFKDFTGRKSRYKALLTGNFKAYKRFRTTWVKADCPGFLDKNSVPCLKVI